MPSVTVVLCPFPGATRATFLFLLLPLPLPPPLSCGCDQIPLGGLAMILVYRRRVSVS